MRFFGPMDVFAMHDFSPVIRINLAIGVGGVCLLGIRMGRRDGVFEILKLENFSFLETW